MLSSSSRLFAIYLQKQSLLSKTLCSNTPILSPQSNSSSTGDGQASPFDKNLPTFVPKDFKKVLQLVQNYHCIYIKVCKHNVITTLTTPEGKPLDWATCGLLGFKNARKRTEFASTAVGRCIGEKTLAKRIKGVHLKIKGLALKRRVATVKGIVTSGLKVMAISDNTPLPFGKGQKPPAARSL